MVEGLGVASRPATPQAKRLVRSEELEHLPRLIVAQAQRASVLQKYGFVSSFVQLFSGQPYCVRRRTYLDRFDAS
jgi:hypothetical protein